MKNIKLKKTILLVICVLCMTMPFASFAASSSASKTVYNKDKTVYGSTSALYTSGTLKDTVKIWAAIGGQDCSAVISDNAAKILITPNKKGSATSYKFYYGHSIYGTKRTIGISNTSAKITVYVPDDGSGYYTVYGN